MIGFYFFNHNSLPYSKPISYPYSISFEVIKYIDHAPLFGKIIASILFVLALIFKNLNMFPYSYASKYTGILKLY